MGSVIDFNLKRKELIGKLTADRLLKQYWNRKIPVDILQMVGHFKEFNIDLQEFDCSVDDEFKKFNASIKKTANNYIMTYKNEMNENDLRMCVCIAVSYIIDGIVDELNEVHIDKKLLAGFQEYDLRSHEERAIEFTKEMLMPVDAIIQALDVLKKHNIETNISNIAFSLQINSIYLAMRRLSELEFLKKK